MAFNGNTPAQYVTFLTTRGIDTRVGQVPITSYVSTGGRSPRARAVLRLFEHLLDGFSDSLLDSTVASPRHRPRPYPGADRFSSPLATSGLAVTGLNALEQLRDRIIARGGGRSSNWRRVFTGQGSIENTAEVMNFIAEHQEMLRAVVPADGGPSPLAPYLNEAGGDGGTLTALRRMVADEVFGMDCLGFTGSYLVWCGLLSRYPELRQHQYVTVLHFNPVATAAEITARCVVLWLDTAVQHIGFVDSVTGTDGHAVVVTLCQSSTGGPQTNTEVRLMPAPSRYAEHGISARKFQISGGNPTIPVTGQVVVAKLATW